MKKEHKSSKQQLSFADTTDGGVKLWSNDFTGIGNMSSLLVFLFMYCLFVCVVYILVRFKLVSSVFRMYFVVD